MVLSRATCYRYSLPLVDPLDAGGESFTVREGTLLCIEGREGAVGWGEAAPLPGFSRETNAEARQALVDLASDLPGRSVSDPLELPDTVQHPFEATPPSVQFAVESALVELAAAHRDQTPGEWLGGHPSVTLNGLIAADAADVSAGADQYWARGFRTLKLKVGRRSIEEDVERVHALAQVLGDDGRIRLDANRAWSEREAVAFGEALDPVPLEYIEEPLADPARLPSFAAHTDLPVALDETTRERSPAAVNSLAPIAAVVLKPTLLGGLTMVRRWRQAAQDVEAVPVLSASYESGVGLRMLVALASWLSTAPAGLSTYERLDADVLAPRLPLEGPTVSVTAMAESTVDRGRLERVASFPESK